MFSTGLIRPGQYENPLPLFLIFNGLNKSIEFPKERNFDMFFICNLENVML